MYYKKKNTNLKLIILISIITLTILIGLTAVIVSAIKMKNKKNDNNKTVIELISPEIKVINLNENDKDVKSVKLKIEASIDDEKGIDYVINLNTNEKYTEFPKEIEIMQNGIYTFKVVAKNTKTKEAKIEVKQIKEASARDPYIPEGFTKKDDTNVDDGFVIVDKNGNEYVWIPVESGKLPQGDGSEMQEYRDEDSGVFNNSVSKNYGFYVARYEAGINEDPDNYQVPVSKPNANVWNKVTYPQAKLMAQKVAEANRYSSTTYTSLINGGAWRAILDWCEKEEEGYKKSTNFGNYWDGLQRAGSGNDIIKNIYNLAGNVKEWTNEMYLRDTRTEKEKKENVSELTNRILRGGSGNMSPFTPEFRTYASANNKDEYWGFRVILFVDKPSINGKVKQENKDNENKNTENKEDKENSENSNEKEEKNNNLRFNN